MPHLADSSDPPRDLNVVNASCLARIRDHGGPRRGREQAELDLIEDGAVAIRNGRIAGVGPTDAVGRAFGDDDVPVLDAAGKTVLPGLVECHSHPLFAGERRGEYSVRLAGGGSAGDIATSGGSMWSTVLATRAASDELLRERLAEAYRLILAGGATTLEVKSGYGLSVEAELRGLALLEASRSDTPMELVVSFLGAHAVPPDAGGADRYVDLIEREMLPRVVDSGLADFHDVTCERGIFCPSQTARLLERSRELNLPARTHADAWAPSVGWKTSVAGHAVSAEHLTYTPDEEIREVGAAETIAVLLPAAELVYVCEKRANARLFIDQEVPVAIASDYCSSIHGTSLATTIALAAPWFRMTPAEAIVGATLNAAYSLQRGQDRGSIEVGKRGDLTILDCSHPEELCLRLGASVVSATVIAGHVAFQPPAMGHSPGPRP